MIRNYLTKTLPILSALCLLAAASPFGVAEGAVSDSRSVDSVSSYGKTNPGGTKDSAGTKKRESASEGKKDKKEKNAKNAKNAKQKKSVAASAGKKPANKGRGREDKGELVIRAGLFKGKTSVVAVSGEAMIIRDDNSWAELFRTKAEIPVTIAAKGGNFTINGKDVQAKKIRFTFADTRPSSHITVDGGGYRGEIVLSMAKGGSFTVVNEVKMDDYIGGVVTKEMSPDWPFEALKAQAVAARTFAAYSLKRHEEEGFDVCSSTHCQVYGGIKAESPSGLRAVSATRGEVMTYQNAPIYAAFHASSGGMTAGSEENSGTALPYLVAVKDPQDDATPNRHWQVKLSARELSAKLRAAGFPVGDILAVELTPLHIGKSASDRYPSGRVKEARFIGARGSVAVPGPKLRTILSLPGTLFEIRVGENQKNVPNKETRITLKKRNNEILIFDGWGRGHGIGMAQWGARNMAGKKKYRDILNHYYTNVETKWLF